MAGLRRASWRGVPFGLDMSQGVYGRRKVRHDYPHRDVIWLEDQGKLPREFRVIGFLISNSVIYGGGDVAGQIARMERAAEQSGPGILVHPTRGALSLDLVNCVISERTEDGLGTYAEVQFAFVQSSKQVFPTVFGGLSGVVGVAAKAAEAAGLGDFVGKVAGPLKQGLGAAAEIAQTASEWLEKVDNLATDATGLYSTLSQLGGADFGRYFNGRNAGFLSGLSSAYAGAQSVTDLIALGSQGRAKVAKSTAAVRTAIGSLGVSADAAAVGSAMQASVDALRAVVADPQDGIRIVGELVRFTPQGTLAGSVGGQATSDLFQRAAAAALARISATYAPASADDAHAVRARVLAPVEVAISRAGAVGADDVFASYRALRKAVVDDLGARGGALARLAELRFDAPLPAVVMAQQRYGDAGRAGELVTQADPVHPWFMPIAFRALGS